MSYSISLIAVPYFVALFLSGFISVYSFVFYERTRTTLLFSALSSSFSIWIFGTVFGILANEVELMVFWEYFRYIGICLASVFFFLYALSFTSFAPKLFSQPRILVALFIPPLIDYLLLITNNIHWLFYTEFTLHPSAPIPLLKYSYGILYSFHSFIIATYIVGGAIALIQVYRRSLHRVYRRQFQLLFIGGGFFCIVVIISALKIFPISEYLDVAPLAYMITCILIIVDIGEYHLIDIVPLANKIIMANLTKTGIIATDNKNRIIEMNPIAQEYLISNEKVGFIGKSLFLVIDSQTHLQSYIRDKFRVIENSLLELQRDPGLSQSFELDLIHPVTLKQEYFHIGVETIQVMERLTGYMYILRNVTPEKMMEAATRKSIDFKDSLLGVISHDLRNQLFVIHGFTEVIRKELSEGIEENKEELYEFLDGIDAKVEEASIAIKNVRNYLKIMGSFDEPVKPIQIDLSS